MFTVGQPNHVYDADYLARPLSVARSSSTANLELLTGESREVDPATPVIRDAKATVAPAGIMGDLSTAVSTDSRR